MVDKIASELLTVYVCLFCQGAKGFNLPLQTPTLRCAFLQRVCMKKVYLTEQDFLECNFPSTWILDKVTSNPCRTGLS